MGATIMLCFCTLIIVSFKKKKKKTTLNKQSFIVHANKHFTPQHIFKYIITSLSQI